jgi:hypothetical protein
MYLTIVRVIQKYTTLAHDFALFVPALHGYLVCLGERLPRHMGIGLSLHVS